MFAYILRKIMAKLNTDLDKTKKKNKKKKDDLVKVVEKEEDTSTTYNMGKIDVEGEEDPDQEEKNTLEEGAASLKTDDEDVNGDEPFYMPNEEIDMGMEYLGDVDTDEQEASYYDR